MDHRKDTIDFLMEFVVSEMVRNGIVRTHGQTKVGDKEVGYDFKINLEKYKD
ncbi:MAG: hypothetical protein [Caudoviricetes sp.]|nr:MAG: hypothetical protein [Caudoviricetes sp.]